MSHCKAQNTPTEFTYEELLIEAGEITQEDVTTVAFTIATGNDTVKATLKKGTFQPEKTSTSLYTISGETVTGAAFENDNKTVVLTITAADDQNSNAAITIKGEAFDKSTVVTASDVQTPIASTQADGLSLEKSLAKKNKE